MNQQLWSRFLQQKSHLWLNQEWEIKEGLPHPYLLLHTIIILKSNNILDCHTCDPPSGTLQWYVPKTQPVAAVDFRLKSNNITDVTVKMYF